MLQFLIIYLYENYNYLYCHISKEDLKGNTNFIPGKAEAHTDKESFGSQESWLVCKDESQLFHGSAEVLTALTMHQWPVQQCKL